MYQFTSPFVRTCYSIFDFSRGFVTLNRFLSVMMVFKFFLFLLLLLFFFIVAFYLLNRFENVCLTIFDKVCTYEEIVSGLSDTTRIDSKNETQVKTLV